jgi:16S rRNA (cytosine1402-N4)-methyltransferase
MTSFEHVTVLRDTAVALLAAGRGDFYVDGTVGAGGHAERLLTMVPTARLVGIDRDPAALEAARERLRPFGDRVTLVQGNFRYLDQMLPRDWRPCAGVLLDLGVSSPQLDDDDRGFSYQTDAVLDMRMDPSSDRTAFRLVNMGDVAELTRVLREYGEERWASRIARFIADARRRQPIRTTGQLVEVIKDAIPAAARRTGGHPARRTFQALRIWVNEELDALDEGLDAAARVLGPGGRAVVLSFQSLEDRMVKRRFRTWADAERGTILTRRPVTPDPAELEENPRSHSAKLRAFEMSAQATRSGIPGIAPRHEVGGVRYQNGYGI